MFPFSIENDITTNKVDKVNEKCFNNKSTINIEKPTTLDNNRKLNEPEINEIINERSDSPIVKVEIKSEIESTQQATGSNTLPLHATNTKHPVCTYL